MLTAASTDNWVTVPTNSTLTIHKQTVMIHPIIDEYYNHSPSYTRKSEFAKSKGLVSNAPGITEVMTPAMEDGSGAEDYLAMGGMTRRELSQAVG